MWPWEWIPWSYIQNDLIVNEYGIKSKGATYAANIQDNEIWERIHQVTANHIIMFDLQTNYLDEDDPWLGRLAATDFAVQITYNTTLWARPGQMVFGNNMELNTPLIADWKAISTRN